MTIPIEQAVVLAAGKGTRIRTSDSDRPKPLHEVAGETLIKRTLLALAEGGIGRVTIVVGFMADEIIAAVEGEAAYALAGLTIDFVHNPDYELANGVSVISVKDVVVGPFVLSMSDHIYDAKLPALAAAADMTAADLYLCVDRDIDEVYDIDDATKVRTRDSLIIEIGKTIATYDCIDCGVFAVSPALVEILQSVRLQKGDCSLSDGVQQLAANQRARVVAIEGAFWQDVDTPDAIAHAEAVMKSRG